MDGELGSAVKHELHTGQHSAFNDRVAVSPLEFTQSSLQIVVRDWFRKQTTGGNTLVFRGDGSSGRHFWRLKNAVKQSRWWFRVKRRPS